MTKKNEVNLDTYKKKPRRLTNKMLNALEPGGVLNPLLAAVAQGDRLRLEIRDHRFNIYYSGGSLLRVAGSKSGWEMHFDENYFKGDKWYFSWVKFEASNNKEINEFKISNERVKNIRFIKMTN